MGSPVRIELTPDQEEACFLAGGLRRRFVELERKQLQASLLLARVLEGGGGGKLRDRVTLLVLTAEQQELLRRVTGKAAASLAVPHPAASDFVYTEDWSPDFAPIRVGSLLILAAGVSAEVPEGGSLIRLDPEALPSHRVFGTGAHPTTQLLLLLLQRRLQLGQRVLDVGTGSGILAVAAARLGAAEVRAIDTDPAALAVARRNVALNGVEGVVQVSGEDLSPGGEGGCDLALVNLPSAVVISLLPALAGEIRPGGWLLASGFTSARLPLLLEAAGAAGFLLVEQQGRGNWVGLVLSRRAESECGPRTGWTGSPSPLRGAMGGAALLAFAALTAFGSVPAQAATGSRGVVADRASRGVSPSRALQALALHSGRVVVYVGAPTGAVTLPSDAGSLAEVAGRWAEQWNAATFCTPDALFFLAPGTFRHVRPAHQDDQLVVHRVLPLLRSLPPSLLARVAPRLGELPGRAETDPRGEGLALAELERERPGVAAELRELLRQAGARAGGAESPGGPVALHGVPAERLRVRLRGQTVAVCGIDAETVALEFPLSLARYAVQHPFAGDGASLRASLTRRDPLPVTLVEGKLGDLLRGGSLLPKPVPGTELGVDQRLRELPLRIAVPAPYRGRPLWHLLERGVGVERRALGPVQFFGPWLDAAGEERFRFLCKWAQVRGELYLPLFTPFVTRPRWIAPSALDRKARETLLAELRGLQAEGHPAARRIPLGEFLKRGRLMMTQREHLEVLCLAEPGADRSPGVLGSYRFLLQ